MYRHQVTQLAGPSADPLGRVRCLPGQADPGKEKKERGGDMRVPEILTVGYGRDRDDD